MEFTWYPGPTASFDLDGNAIAAVRKFGEPYLSAEAHRQGKLMDDTFARLAVDFTEGKE